MALLFATTFCFAASQSLDISSSFDSANKLYEQGEFANAAGAYEKLIETKSVSPALYYNLGNALFKSGQIGRAIAAYRQAEKMSPRDPELKANLQFARNRVQGPTLQTGRWERWLGKFSLNEWTWTGVVMIWLTFGLLAIGQLWPKSKRAIRPWTTFAAFATVVVCGLLGCALAHRLSVQIAVVKTNEVTVRTGPFDESQIAFTAHDGAEFRVLDQKDGWLQVSDGARRIGWIKNSDALTANPT